MFCSAYTRQYGYPTSETIQFSFSFRRFSKGPVTNTARLVPVQAAGRRAVPRRMRGHGELLPHSRKVRRPRNLPAAAHLLERQQRSQLCLELTGDWRRSVGRRRAVRRCEHGELRLSSPHLTPMNLAGEKFLIEEIFYESRHVRLVSSDVTLRR